MMSTLPQHVGDRRRRTRRKRSAEAAELREGRTTGGAAREAPHRSRSRSARAGQCHTGASDFVVAPTGAPTPYGRPPSSARPAANHALRLAGSSACAMAITSSGWHARAVILPMLDTPKRDEFFGRWAAPQLRREYDPFAYMNAAARGSSAGTIRM
jgi:hypothetical protein